MLKALIGITGQDGGYLAEFLIPAGYEVPGLERRSSSTNANRWDQSLVNYLKNHGFHAPCGIPLNHEAPEGVRCS
jgi:GDP-D-mannose dehydratase